MEALRVRNGNMLLAILVIGRITAKMGSESSSTKMEISMKECGPKIRDMDKEHIGEMKQVN